MRPVQQDHVSISSEAGSQLLNSCVDLQIRAFLAFSLREVLPPKIYFD